MQVGGVTRRLLVILLIAAGLSPGLFWREKPPLPNASQRIAAMPVSFTGGASARPSGLTGPRLVGVWHLTGANDHFGSYSALLALADNSLLAISDRGKFLRMSLPPEPEQTARLGEVFPQSDAYKQLQDIESVTRDPATGRIWLGLEGRNAIIRTEADFSDARTVQPGAMRDWRGNGGPEAMVRLHDGRFIVLAESPFRRGDRDSPALLFAGDPVEGAASEGFGFAPPPGYYPSDMAELPDGRVLVLLRGVELGLPPAFTTRLVLADPASIRPGEVWQWQPLAELDAIVPRENYEGLDVTGGTRGEPVTLWLISDDNESRLIQRTLLVRLEWRVPQRKQARGDAARLFDTEIGKPG